MLSTSTASTTALNPAIVALIEKHPAQLPFVIAGTLLNFTPNAARIARSRGQFPVRVRRRGMRLIVFTSDMVQYLTDGISQAGQSIKPLRKSFRVHGKSGRPAKRERLEAESKGISVKELRASRVAE